MARQRLFGTPQVARLQAILESIREGDLLLPDFQRPFVWTTEQRLLLLDSILAGMPIGSLLIWRTSKVLKTQEQIGPHALPALRPDPVGGTHNYVLDGLQRLSTLYASLISTDPARTPLGADDTASDPTSDDVRWPIYFNLRDDLDEGNHTRFRQLSATKASQSPTWLPLSVLFDDQLLWRYQTKLFSAGFADEGNKAKHLANRFADYEIALVPIITDNEELATKSFERINTQGSKMGEPHMLRALIYTKFKLNDEFERVVTESAWPEIDPKMLVNTLKTILGQDVYRANMRAIGDAITEERGAEVFGRLATGVRGATTFLHERCGVHGQAALPYAYQFVALACAAASGHDLDDDRVAPALVRWFWSTTYAEYFTGLTGPQLSRVFADVIRIAQGRPSWAMPAESTRQSAASGNTNLPPSITLPQEIMRQFRGNSVRAKALMHQLSGRTLVELDGHPADTKSLLARGSVVFQTLYPRSAKTNPANRLLAAPETIRELRRALADESHPHVTALRRGHLLPPLDSPDAETVEHTLAWRRLRLEKMEIEFIASLKDVEFDMVAATDEAKRAHTERARAAASALGATPSADELVAWFLRLYEDPANGVPYDGREGGYQYIYGGPWQAEDELSEWFPEADDDVLQQATEELHQHGWEWIKAGLY